MFATLFGGSWARRCEATTLLPAITYRCSVRPGATLVPLLFLMATSQLAVVYLHDKDGGPMLVNANFREKENARFCRGYGSTLINHESPGFIHCSGQALSVGQQP